MINYIPVHWMSPYSRHCTDCLIGLWSNLVTLASQPRAPCLHYLLPPPRAWDQSLIFWLTGLIKN